MIPIGWEDHAEKIGFARDHQFGIEVAAFATGPALQEPGTRATMERSLAAALRSFSGSLSYHGAFIDLSLHSEDPAVAGVARKRIKRDLATAERLGCRIVVFHTGFNPLVPVTRYEEQFLERHAAFWPDVAEAWPDITICLENMWEPSPHLLERLLRKIGHPRVSLCLDVAHAHVYGDFAAETWLHRLGTRIAHMHWNDNHGDADAHLPIGAGNIPWRKIIAVARPLFGKSRVVLELNSLRAIRQSLCFLRETAPADLVLPSSIQAHARNRSAKASERKHSKLKNPCAWQPAK